MPLLFKNESYIVSLSVALNDVDAAMNLFNEKKANDSAMTSYFLRKLANFLSSSGREVPFDIEAIAKVMNLVFLQVIDLCSVLPCFATHDYKAILKHFRAMLHVNSLILSATSIT